MVQQERGRERERERAGGTEPLGPAAAVMVDVAREMTFCTERRTRTPTLGWLTRSGAAGRHVECGKKCVCPRATRGRFEFLTSRITQVPFSLTSQVETAATWSERGTDTVSRYPPCDQKWT